MTEQHFLTSIFSEKIFTAEELREILSKFQKVVFPKNHVLLCEGQTENNYWFIESGFMRSYVNNTDGDDISTNFYGHHDIVIDWSSFFLRSPTRENIHTLTECTCWQLNFDSFQQLFHGIQSFREQGRTNLVSSYFALKQQSVSMIADPAKDRYLRLVKERPHIVQNVSLKYIATYLGITDTSLSRIRKEISEG
jgi:CRP-like cAMP-binding protein